MNLYMLTRIASNPKRGQIPWYLFRKWPSSYSVFLNRCFWSTVSTLYCWNQDQGESFSTEILLVAIKVDSKQLHSSSNWVEDSGVNCACSLMAIATHLRSKSRTLYSSDWLTIHSFNCTRWKHSPVHIKILCYIHRHLRHVIRKAKVHLLVCTLYHNYDIMWCMDMNCFSWTLYIRGGTIIFRNKLLYIITFINALLLGE